MSDGGRDRDRAPGDLHGSGIGRFVIRCEEILFAVILAALLVSGLLPIIFRFLDLSGVNWSGSLSSHLVLWLALFGAGAATRDRKHISIDAISHLLSPRARLALRAAVELVAAVACAVLVPAAVSFVGLEAELTGEEIAFLGVPKSWLPAVIPIGLSLLVVRFLLAAWVDARAARGWTDESGES